MKSWYFGNKLPTVTKLRAKQTSYLMARLRSYEAVVVLNSRFVSKLARPVFFVATLPSQLTQKEVSRQAVNDQLSSRPPLKHIRNDILISRVNHIL